MSVGRRCLLGAVTTVLAAAVLASLALAAETTRAEYNAGVEPICKNNTKGKRTDPRRRQAGGPAGRAEVGGSELHQGLERPEEGPARN
jgi:hypothetical protein